MSEALRQIGQRPVLLEINSRGGDLFEALGGFNLLVRHPAPVGVQIVGLAASAASLIAMSGERIETFKSGQVMVHNAQGIVMGDHNAMRDAAEIFEGFSATARSIYAERTGLEEKAVGKLMDDATWMAAEEAKRLGFVDIVLDQGADDGAASKLKRELKAELRAKGLTRAQIRRAVAAAFGPDPSDDDEELDLDRVAAALNTSFAAVEPYL